MSKKQVEKKAKRKLVSKQKKKQRNINRVQKRKAENEKKEKLINFFSNLSKTEKKDVLKSIEEGE